MIKRIAIGALSLSAVGLVSLAQLEDYRGEAYIPVPGDVPTIGYGHTGPDVQLGDTTTPPRALAILLADANEFERAVRRCAPVPMYQHEFDAYVLMTANIGPGRFCTSTTARRLNVGDYTGACEAMLLFKKFRGRDCSLRENKRLCGGLWTRRQAEYRMCLGEQALAAAGVP